MDFERELTKPADDKPMRDGLLLSLIESEVDGKRQEWIRKAVVGSRLSRKDLPEVERDMLPGKLATYRRLSIDFKSAETLIRTHNSSAYNWVCGRQAGGDSEARYE